MTRPGMLVTGIVVVFGAAMWWAMGAGGSEPAAGARVRIGTYDTRAVALAWGRGPEAKQEIDTLIQESAKAKAAGDEKRITELKRRASARQQKNHAMVFGAVMIDEVVAKLKADVPVIAKQAKVVAVVPAVNWQDPSVELVDVTDGMVAFFKPDEKTMKIIADCRKHKPLDLQQVFEHED